MAKLFIPASLRPLTDGLRMFELPGPTVRDLLSTLENRYPSLIGRLRDGDRLRQGLCVSINDQVSNRGLAQAVGEQDEVHFVSAIGGG